MNKARFAGTILGARRSHSDFAYRPREFSPNPMKLAHTEPYESLLSNSSALQMQLKSLLINLLSENVNGTLW